MRILLLLAALSITLATVGCHSRIIQASVTNHTGATIDLIEVDYPSASFGTQSLAAGATYRYSFKIIGSGPTTLVWTDAKRRTHKSSGPELHENQEGSLTIEIGPDADSHWSLQGAPAR